ncbi:hypothetical protein NC653_023535 [Populus alba x Populus x berolinensis]|uniref:Uncharacterized protein n=1 Tax=Populus alba x Populus x berolinensis TaxID=444605 RepID=A0AAD6MHV3_9ROSI|nr:hypothetical protein NC653_023535 [Populus alba x Populus x berolinensis]
MKRQSFKIMTPPRRYSSQRLISCICLLTLLDMQGMFPSPDKTSENSLARLRGQGKIERHFEKSIIFKLTLMIILPVRFSPGRDNSMAMVKQRTVGNRYW